MTRIWSCKIGGVTDARLDGNEGSGADHPMREAVSRAYERLTGIEAEFIFSGWGAELTKSEHEVVEEQRAKREREGRLEAARPEEISIHHWRAAIVLAWDRHPNAPYPELPDLADAALVLASLR